MLGLVVGLLLTGLGVFLLAGAMHFASTDTGTVWMILAGVVLPAGLIVLTFAIRRALKKRA
jgi:hypothetical protein